MFVINLFSLLKIENQFRCILKDFDMNNEVNLSDTDKLQKHVSFDNAVIVEVPSTDNVHPEPTSIYISNNIPTNLIGSPIGNYKLQRPSLHLNKYENYQLYCGIPFLFFVGIGFIVCTIAYLIFGIMFLVDNKDMNDNCNSNMWNYVLTIIIMFFISIGSKKFYKKEIFKLLLIISGLINIGLGAWGIHIYTKTTCQELINSNIYTWAQISSIFTTIVGCIELISGIIVCIYKYFKNI